MAKTTKANPFKFIVKGVQTIAFDNQKVELENETKDAQVIIHLRNQEDFDSFEKGKEVDMTIVDSGATVVEEEETEVQEEQA